MGTRTPPVANSHGTKSVTCASTSLGKVMQSAVVILIRLARTRPLLTPLVPVVNGAVWYAVISLGGAVLGWTA